MKKYKELGNMIKYLQDQLDKKDAEIFGIMHSVDKWFDEVDESVDNVNRSAKAREIALQAIEKLQEKNEELKKLILWNKKIAERVSGEWII